MPEIRLLEESIAQKIAAGEVVERPASVVKELLENSIDAGSTFVTVEIMEGGVEHIRVTDNGCGIPSGEVEMAFLRHATSKIQNLADLFNISQLGFRGEALYSVAAVSKLELTTKPATQPAGERLIIHGGRKVSLSDIGCPDGTTIIAADLFYNTPARLKFLNKPAVEASYVSAIVFRHILAHPAVTIKFVANGKVLYHSAGDGSLKNAVYAVFGKEVAQGLLEVDGSADRLSVSGYLFSPADAGFKRSRQMLIVNGRPVNNPTVSSIVERVYVGLTDGKKFPGYVLNLTLPPADVDVNIHPNKLQVRFSDEHSVKRLVEAAVSKAVERLKGTPVAWAFPEAVERSGMRAMEETTDALDKPEKHDAARTAQAETIGESVDRLKESVRAALGGSGFAVPWPQPQQYTLMQRPVIQTAIPEEAQDDASASPQVRLIGQCFDTYALMEFGDRLLIVDQHAAHERLLFDRYMARLRGQEPCSQPLLIPQVIKLPHELAAVLEENFSLLSSLGFDVEEYGNLSYQARTVPFILGQPQMQGLLPELLEILSEDRAARSEELKKEKVMSMACRKAVKAGDRLSPRELSALAGIIAAENAPLTCPHGRPFVIVLDRKSLEKQFRRTK